MAIAIIHTYLSGLLEANLKFHLQISDELISNFLLIFCRFQGFPDAGIDPNIEMVKTKFKREIESGRIVIYDLITNPFKRSETEYVYNPTEFEVRESVMNSMKDHIRVWIDSDELLYGRYWHLNHISDGVCAKIKHTVINQSGINYFEGIPYVFGRGVTIKYSKHHFLSLQAFYNGNRIEPIKLDDLGNFSQQFIENPDYAELKKSWILFDQHVRGEIE